MMNQSIEIERRTALAEEFFMKGFNCCQSVVAAYAAIVSGRHCN